MVYSPLDALQDRAREPGPRGGLLRDRLRDDGALDRADAAAGRRPRASGTSRVFCNHVTIIPAIKAILDSPDLRLDGFIGPGHVSTVIGTAPVPVHRRATTASRSSSSGFEPLDILQGVYMMLRQLARGPRRGREPVHARRPRARATRARSRRSPRRWSCATTFEWRGLGFISQSALKLRDGVRRLGRRAALRRARRARRRPEGVPVRRGAEGRDQAVGVQGVRHRLHAGDPIGTCMVSREGACAAYYNYGRHAGRRGARRRRP